MAETYRQAGQRRLKGVIEMIRLSKIYNELVYKGYERELCDDQFALFHNPKGKTYKRLPKGFKVVEDKERIIVLD
ncbi:MAG: hypothetical protein MN733_33985 [Nitrososphaera sp.]|nr:hypothetical protein [Nitrososphaera sp.]